MKYMLLIYRDEAAFQAPKPGGGPSAPYLAYSKALEDAAVRLDGARLQPTASASTVRIRSGKTEILDGPYAETREQLAGYYVIDVPDLDAALDWAARCPAAEQGMIEVRPLVEA